MPIIPAWRALPMWAKIILAPLVLSASITMVLVAVYTLAGLITVIDASISGAVNYFRKAKREIAGTRHVQASA